MTVVNFDPGEIAYEAYKLASDGASLVSGAALPDWADVEPRIRDAWSAVEDGVIIGLGAMRQELPLDEPKPAERYALVEQMGFRRTYGTVRETEFCGRPMIELTSLETGAVALVAPESLYQVTWLTRAQAESATRTGSHSPAALSAAIADDLASWGADGEYGDDDGERDTARRMDALDEAARLEAGL